MVPFPTPLGPQTMRGLSTIGGDDEDEDDALSIWFKVGVDV